MTSTDLLIIKRQQPGLIMSGIRPGGCQFNLTNMSEQLYNKTENGEYVPFGPTDYEEFRDKYWSPGLWLVTEQKNSKSRSWLHKLCEIPEKPQHYAGLMALNDELCGLLLKLQDPVIYSDDKLRYRTTNEKAKAILNWLAEKQGNKLVPFHPDEQPDRKIEMNL